MLCLLHTHGVIKTSKTAKPAFRNSHMRLLKAVEGRLKNLRLLDCQLQERHRSCTGTTPLSSLCILDLPTARWLPVDRVNGNGPSPRGQPTMVTTSDQRRLLVFGGWDGKQRHNDLHSLDIVSLKWEQIFPQGGGGTALPSFHTRLYKQAANSMLLVEWDAALFDPASSDLQVLYKLITNVFCIFQP